jgi:hypothetical protein
MSYEILTATDGRAVLADTGTDWAFGPVFESPEHAEAFIRWLGKDPRDLMLQAVLSGRDPDVVLEAAYLDWLVAQRTAADRTPQALPGPLPPLSPSPLPSAIAGSDGSPLTSSRAGHL